MDDRMEQFFEWDEEKAQKNFRKHGIRFEVAARVFDDPLAVSSQDRIVDGECRWQTLGTVEGCTLLVVAHTVRDAGDAEIIRIISARRAEPRERRRYEHSKIQAQ